MLLDTLERSPFALSDADCERLAARLQLAVKRARRSGRQTLAALTLPLPADLDPSAVACASRRPGESWFLLEQPERGGRALAALGEAVCLTATGPERFATVADRWRALAAAAVSDPPEDPSDSGSTSGGPIALGGFAFAAEGGADLAWSGFAPASLIVPEVAFTREQRPGRRTGGASPTPLPDPRVATDGMRVRMTLCALAAPDDTAEQLLARLERRVGELRVEPLRAARPRAHGALPDRERDAAGALRGRRRARGRADPRRAAREGGARARGAGARGRGGFQLRPRRAVRGAARGLPLVHGLLRWSRRRRVRRRQPRAAGASRGPPRQYARARRLDAPQCRPRRRRPPRRTARCTPRRTARSTRS